MIGRDKPTRRSLFAVAVIVTLAKISLYFIFAGSDLKLAKGAGIFIPSADHSEYVEPIDNLVDFGTYRLTNTERPYAGRLPGFIVPYVLFRFFTGPFLAGQMLGVFILLFSVIASVTLFTLIWDLTGSKSLCWIAIICGSIIPYFWHWDWTLHPFSLSCSCLVFVLYFLNKIRTDLKPAYVFWAGFFLAWLFMLRGFTFLFIPICLAYLIWLLLKRQLESKMIVRMIALFLITVTISEGIWVTRNFISIGKFVPLQTAFVKQQKGVTPEYGSASHVKYSLMKVREMISAWGGDNFWYFPEADMNWFTDKLEKQSAEDQFPRVVTSVISPAELQNLRDLIQASFLPERSLVDQYAFEDEIEQKSVEYRRRFVEQRRAYNLFVAPIKRLKNFLIKNPTQDWFGPDFRSSNIFQKSIKLISTLVYSFLLISIPVVFLLMLRGGRSISGFYWLLFSLVISLLFTFSELVNASHFSYFILGFPPLLILIISFWRPGLWNKINEARQ
jgi:hypothetical protein